jgi:hypothetical protein
MPDLARRLISEVFKPDRIYQRLLTTCCEAWLHVATRLSYTGRLFSLTDCRHIYKPKPHSPREWDAPKTFFFLS